MKDNILHRRTALAVAAALMLAGFVLIALLMVSGRLEELDEFIRLGAYDIRTPALNTAVKAITHTGDGVTMIAVGLTLLLVTKLRKNYGIPYVTTALTSTVIYKTLKMAFGRPRPDVAFRLVEQWDKSFPSGHSMNCLVGYGILIYLIRKHCPNKDAANALTAALSVLIALIGSSRIYLGVHYFSDVIGGWSLGIAVLLMSIIVLEELDKGKGLEKNVNLRY